MTTGKGPKATSLGKATSLDSAKKADNVKPALTDADFAWAATQLGCDVAAIKAVDAVESRGIGFLPDGQPVILFERHIFHKLTNGAWSTDTDKEGRYLYQNISWPRPGGYGATGQHQHDRLARAVALDRTAALYSASWGRFQLMGFNHPHCGHPTLQSFINAMYRSERDQLEAFVAFLKSQKLDRYLRSHQWERFAAGYNGPNHWKNNYAPKLSTAWKRFAKEN